MTKDERKNLLHPLYINNGCNKPCHPNAPNGGGGCGAFTQAGILGASYEVYSSQPHPYSPAARYLIPEEIGKVAKKFSITSIPNIMESNKWYKGAALMRSWFARKTMAAPVYDSPDNTTITMDWVLNFKRAKTVYDKLIAERIWINELAKKQIANMLISKGLIIPNSCFVRSFGNLLLPASQLDEDAINFRSVGMSSIDLDDMDAALGNFTFKVLIAGTVSSDDKARRYKVEITQVGVYIKDSYDFNGDQFLGYWDNTDNSVSMFNPLSGTGVSNQDFRNWRAKNNKGGDFQVFSDIKQLDSINLPDTVYIAIK